MHPTVLYWQGAIPIGRGNATAPYDPANNPDTMTALAAWWREEFVLNVGGDPSALSMRATWTAHGLTKGVYFMAISPPEGSSRILYHAAPTNQTEICLHLPPAALVAGQWRVMLHAQQTVAMSDNVTVTVTGAPASIQEPTGASPAGVRELLPSTC
ncbi:MAG: hypothetical protein ACYDBQ_09335 [Thermoplasmatota archaeon]